MDSLSKNLALHSSTYENYITLGNFNPEVDNNAIISSLCDAFDRVNLLREPTFHRMTVTVTQAKKCDRSDYKINFEI